MAEHGDSHVIEIPVDGDILQLKPVETNDLSLIQHHPLMEISQSPGHLLLLKLWQRKEDKFNGRIARKETQMDNLKCEVFQLCCFFFAFHGFLLTFLFNASGHLQERAQRQWWIPFFLSLTTSLAIIFFVQLKLYRYHKFVKKLQRDRSDNRALVRCIQELRMKGASFDLSKEPLTTKRMKSSSVEIKWRPLLWLKSPRPTISMPILFCFKHSKTSQLIEIFERSQLDNTRVVRTALPMSSSVSLSHSHILQRLLWFKIFWAELPGPTGYDREPLFTDIKLLKSSLP
ncbi:hypothetical protein H6P81_008763 [Aristolochia fimbriata]|uniref:Uncharacterized protein n=1 Tax=Aristolochia fimbriata TaxID=158543 RepID=A0AAV7EJ50_ARIFI|nr:hypothetical protein H6P81_008763 [Aristolochia fimbriata]